MYYILHQHYESVPRLVKIVSPEKINEIYKIFDNEEFLKLKPRARLKFLQESLPIPDSKHFTLDNFKKVAQQTVDEMEEYNIAHVDLRLSLHLERWKDVNGAGHAIKIYNQALSGYIGKSISYIAAIDLTKSKDEIKKSLVALFEEKNINLISGIDITLCEGDLDKFEKYYKDLLEIRNKFNKKIIIHLGEFTSGTVNLEILKKLKPDRIVHGIALLESAEAIEFIKKNEICLDICPVSNKILGVVNWELYNPIKKALTMGIPVTVNTDDPITFNTNIYKEIKTANLSQQELKVINANSIRFAEKF
ncbi:MAG: hypothetical protein V1891_03585 [bacterium]